MKNNSKLFLLALLLISFTSCTDANKVVDQVVANTTSGAVLRTIQNDANNFILNSSIPSTTFNVILEEQDAQNGALFESIDIFVSIRDQTPNNGLTVANDIYVKTISASEFRIGPTGLPRGTISVTFAEAETAMGLNSNTHAPGDLFVFETKLKLTDGRVFGANDVGSSVTGGFFASPYKYNTLLSCSPKDGVYRVEMHDSFGDGWQTDDGNSGSGITVSIDGNVTEIGMCSPYAVSDFSCTTWPTTDPNYNPESDYHNATAFVTVPVGATSANWNFPGDNYGEISFEIYAPDGSLLFASGAAGNFGAGLIPVLLCL